VRDSFTTAGHWPGFAGVEVTKWKDGEAEASLEIEQRHLAPNGYLHAGVVVTLADTACGFGCMGSLPEGARGFTTIELKTNFLATARSGQLRCEARLVHGGRTTQIWDAAVVDERDKTLALFRCTQLLIYQ
jgi:1,4-dihydroxy-2-naphthoyl-CoA hydrolase